MLVGSQMGGMRGALMLAVACAVSAPVDAAPLTPTQWVELRVPGEMEWSGDGARLALSVTEPADKTAAVAHIWVYSSTAHALRQFSRGGHREHDPHWSPDGRTLAFVSDRGGVPQIHLMPADGGEAVVLGAGRQSIESFTWSPDGRSIAFIAPVPLSVAQEKAVADGDDAHSVDRDARRSHLWVADVATGATREIVTAPWEVKEAQWLPSGRGLVVVATEHPESDALTSRIYAVDADGKGWRQIGAPAGPFGTLKVSPDGALLSYVGSRADGPVAHDLFVQPLSGQPRNLTAQSLDRPVLSYHWRGPSRLTLVLADGFGSRVCDLAASGVVTRCLTYDGVLDELALTAKGTGAIVSEDITRPPEVWEWNGAAQGSALSSFNSRLAQAAFVAPRYVRYRSADGREIEAAILAPPRAANAPLPPGVILVHGGPAWRWGRSFDECAWASLLAGAGYTVLLPNLRGSVGYGYEFLVSNRGDWGGGDFKDVLAGADYLAEQKLADPSRLGIGGWSYGGYMASWAITQTDRFKAGVAGAGLSDLAAEFGTERDPAYDEWYYGLPYEKPEGFRRSSPITFVARAKTPLLLLQGEADVTDPPSQSQILYRALKRYGVTTDLVMYPREDHGFTETQHRVDVLVRMQAWFDRFLK